MVIGDVLTQVRREVVLEDDKLYKLLGVKWYGQGMFLREEKRGKDIKAKKLYRVHSGDFVYNRLFAWKSSFAIVADDLAGCLVSNEFPTFICDHSKADPEFLLNYVLQPSFINFVDRTSGGMSSVSRKRFKENDFLNATYPDYDIEDQRSIANKIRVSYSQIDNIARTIEDQSNLLVKLRQAVLQEAIEGKLTAEWRKKNLKLISGENHASKLLEKTRTEKASLVKDGKIRKEKPLPPITDAEKPLDLPEGWVWCRLGDICSKIGSGSTPKGSNYSVSGIPFFRSQNVHNDGLVYDDIKFINERVNQRMNGTVVCGGDLLLNITGGSIGRCALVPKEFEIGNVSQHVAIIRPITMLSRFMHFLVLSPYFQKLIFNSTTGAGREGLPKYNLEQFLIPIPSLSEQSEVIDRTEALMKIMTKIDTQIIDRQRCSDMLLKSVLHDAFGKSSTKAEKVEVA